MTTVTRFSVVWLIGGLLRNSQRSLRTPRLNWRQVERRGLSWLAAIPLSIPMSVILAQAFARVMVPVPITYVPEISGVLIWLAIVVGVSIVACAWPAIRAMRVTAVKALAYE
jgi:hypothetical protein